MNKSLSNAVMDQTRLINRFVRTISNGDKKADK